MKGKEWRRKESEKVNISREGKYLKMRGNKGREGAHVRLVESKTKAFKTEKEA